VAHEKAGRDGLGRENKDVKPLARLQSQRPPVRLKQAGHARCFACPQLASLPVGNEIGQVSFARGLAFLQFGQRSSLRLKASHVAKAGLQYRRIGRRTAVQRTGANIHNASEPGRLNEVK
jgi:hypothetical protein